MADLTKNAISLTVRDRAKRTKTWDHKGYKSQITKRVILLFNPNSVVFLDMEALLRKLYKLLAYSITFFFGETSFCETSFGKLYLAYFNW